jgi:DNA repair exonuclease SbcCD ATPase subunit
MDTNLTNRITMQKTTAAYMDANTAIWSPMAPMQTAMETYKQNLSAIDDAAQKQQTPSGATEDKAAARDDLEDVAFLMCEALGALAHAAGDHDLIALTDVTQSTFSRAADDELSSLAATILSAADTRKTELATLQMTQANIDELDQALQRFNASKTNPRMKIGERSARGESLEALVRDNQEFLRKQIDRLVNLFSRTHPDFVAGYRKARVIVDRAATHASSKPKDDTPPAPQ